MVVLVDAGTASSSEIVSGALQDAGRAQIVGVKTYGTGTVLGEFPLSDGSALRVGTVEWLTPDGRQIWHQGITPDVVVERASDRRPGRPGSGRQDDPRAGRRADRPPAGSRPEPRHGGHRDRQLDPRLPGRRATGLLTSAQLASERQRQVISAMSGSPGRTTVGSVLTAFGGAVCGSTQMASGRAV